MDILRGIPAEKGYFKNPVVTLGSFDGVHLGHRRIFSAVLNIARQKAEMLLSLPLIRTRARCSPR